MTFADLLTRLERGLREPLPGAAAQAMLAPIPRRGWPNNSSAHIRDAAGLVLVFPEDGRTMTQAHAPGVPRPSGGRSRVARRGEAHVILTVRAGTLGRHGGQVSLPGGVVDPGESIEQAALREAHEEVALAPGSARVLGALTPIDIPVSGFRLHPVVAVTDAPQTLVPADGEVARILDVAIDDLLHPASFVVSQRERDGVHLRIPAFHVDGEEIWGATAMVLAEFLVLLGWPGPKAD